MTLRPSSPSSSTTQRPSFSSKISALGAKISRTLSNEYGRDSDRDSITSTLHEKEMAHQDRSLSRGRDAFQSSGRGGLGNIRQASVSRDARPQEGPDDFSSSRGREPAVDSNNKVFSTGRGGAGNIRSPSRDALKSQSPLRPDIAEEKVIRSYVFASQDSPHSTGRGGIGNITRSRSRGPAETLPPAVHSTGRGGAGNITAGDGAEVQLADEEERRKRGRTEGVVHSTGRGGVANFTSTPVPIEQHPAPATGGFASTGRGGAGNFRQTRSISADRR